MFERVEKSVLLFATRLVNKVEHTFRLSVMNLKGCSYYIKPVPTARKKHLTVGAGLMSDEQNNLCFALFYFQSFLKTSFTLSKKEPSVCSVIETSLTLANSLNNSA